MTPMPTIHYGFYELVGSSMVKFVVDTIPPSVSSLSVRNMTSDPSGVLLSFDVNETSEVCYSLDDQANVTIAGNTTLTGLSDGSHYLIVYANDSVGNVGKSDVAYFTVNTQPSTSPSPTATSTPTQEPTPSPPSQAESFPPTFLLFAVLPIAAVATAVITYVRKRRESRYE
jgi:hypothetical protein